MPRAKPFEFINALKDLGVDLTSTGDDNNLAIRPNRLMRKLARAGLVVERLKPNYRDLAKFDFNPKTVFDIGVDAGTPFIYKAFPDAHFVLVDPVDESKNRVSRWHDRINYEFHSCAVGSENGETELSIPSSDIKTKFSRSTTQGFARDYSRNFEFFETRRVQVRTLDEIARGKTPPFGIKIDTEGAEMEVIKGAKKTLEQAEFVVAEVSVRERFSGGYKFSEFIAEMGKNGFEPLEILTPFNFQVTDSDILFARRDGPYF